MKKTSIILTVLTLIICIVMCACDGADAGKVKDTTQGLDLTTTQNITTQHSTTYGNALTDASSVTDNLLSTTANSTVTQ